MPDLSCQRTGYHSPFRVIDELTTEIWHPASE